MYSYSRLFCFFSAVTLSQLSAEADNISIMSFAESGKASSIEDPDAPEQLPVVFSRPESHSGWIIRNLTTQRYMLVETGVESVRGSNGRTTKVKAYYLSHSPGYAEGNFLTLLGLPLQRAASLRYPKKTALYYVENWRASSLRGFESSVLLPTANIRVTLPIVLAASSVESSLQRVLETDTRNGTWTGAGDGYYTNAFSYSQKLSVPLLDKAYGPAVVVNGLSYEPATMAKAAYEVTEMLKKAGYREFPR